MRLRAKVGELMMDKEVLEYGMRRYEEELGRPPFTGAEVEELARTTSASAGKPTVWSASAAVFTCRLRFLGITSSPAFVREPEGNGCAEHFIRVLKEQVLWTRWFETIEELRLALLDFKRKYNQHWMVERHQHRTPQAVRVLLESSIAA